MLVRLLVLAVAALAAYVTIVMLEDARDPYGTPDQGSDGDPAL